MRCFIAINLPESVKKVLAVLQNEFKKCGADIRWVRPENIHLTLKFLGNIEENAVKDLNEAIKKACSKQTAFKIRIAGAGAFPNMKSPGVLWTGLDNNKVFTELQKEIEDGTAFLGFKREKRRFVPHLTLGRFRSSRDKKALMDKIEAYKNHEFALFDAGSVCLMKSDLGPAGAKHTKLSEVFLN